MEKLITLEMFMKRLEGHPSYEVCREVSDYIHRVKVATYGEVRQETGRTIDELMTPFVILTTWRGAPMETFFRYWDGDVEFDVSTEERSIAFDGGGEITNPNTGLKYSADAGKLLPGIRLIDMLEDEQ